ncbi:hypothetical protein ACJJTC_006327 [Scirpophaga incertulas]
MIVPKDKTLHGYAEPYQKPNYSLGNRNPELPNMHGDLQNLLAPPHDHSDTSGASSSSGNSVLNCGVYAGGKRARVGGRSGGIARLSAGGYRRALGREFSAASPQCTRHSNNGTSAEQLMGRLPQRTPVYRTLSFPRAVAGAASCPEIGVM